MSIVPATGAPKRTALWPEAWREIRLMLMSYLLRLMLWMCPVDPGTVPIIEVIRDLAIAFKGDLSKPPDSAVQSI